MRYGYPASALRYDRVLRHWSLAGDFDPSRMLCQLKVDGARARILDCLGQIVSEGTIGTGRPILIEDPEGTTLSLDPIEIEGALQLYLASYNFV